MLGFILTRALAIVTLIALFIWAPWVLNPIYAVNGVIWSAITNVVLWLIPDESTKTSLWAILTAFDFLTKGADWVVGIIPNYGSGAQALLRLIVHGAGVLADITMIIVVTVMIRKIRQRRSRRPVKRVAVAH